MHHENVNVNPHIHNNIKTIVVIACTVFLNSFGGYANPFSNFKGLFNDQNALILQSKSTISASKTPHTVT